MLSGSVGFIGGGRITRIMLKGFQNAGIQFENAVVSDISIENLQKLKDEFPGICVSHNDNLMPARQNLVFISLHPPLIEGLLDEIRTDLKPDGILISLAPKITIEKMSAGLGGFDRIVRMIPNAPSIVNSGFNPVSYSSAIPAKEVEELSVLFSCLGESPVVPEEKLEAYAVLTAMGPTYFWFQLFELQRIMGAFGLDEKELEVGISRMMNGTLKTMTGGYTPEEVMDLIPVRPIGDEEAKIKEIYNIKLNQVFNRIKPQ